LQLIVAIAIGLQCVCVLGGNQEARFEIVSPRYRYRSTLFALIASCKITCHRSARVAKLCCTCRHPSRIDFWISPELFFEAACGAQINAQLGLSVSIILMHARLHWARNIFLSTHLFGALCHADCRRALILSSDLCRIFCVK